LIYVIIKNIIYKNTSQNNKKNNKKCVRYKNQMLFLRLTVRGERSVRFGIF
jgi:hypothetical protein